MKSRLRDYDSYQFEIEQFCLDVPKAHIWADMGLGKTVSVGGVIAALNEAGEIYPWLIVAPIKVAVQGWPAEFRKWDHLVGLTFTVVRVLGDEPEIKTAAARCKEACQRLGLHPTVTARIIGRAKTVASHDLWRELAKRPTQVHITDHGAFERLVKLFTKKHWPWRGLIWDESDNLRDHKTNRYRALNYIKSKFKRIYL
jgi:SNF2 family DNA or RNA helicase